MFRKAAAIIVFLTIAVSAAYAAKTVFSDGTPALGIKGTKVTAAFLNSVNAHLHTGLDEDGDGSLAYSTVTGTNDLVATITPTTAFPAAYVAGMPIRFKAAVNCDPGSGDVTLNVNSIGAATIKKPDGSDLSKDDLVAGTIYEVIYDGTNFQLQNGPKDSVGTIVMTGNTTADTGYLLLDGAAVSRTTYSRLYSRMGTTFGVGDGATTFNLPDMRGRSPLGSGQGNTAEGGGAGTLRTLGTSTGAETHTLTESEMPVHDHGMGGITISSGAANAAWGTGAITSTSTAGGDVAHNNMGPVIVVNFQIKY